MRQASESQAPIAQLDRVAHYECEGRGSEEDKSVEIKKISALFYYMGNIDLWQCWKKRGRYSSHSLDEGLNPYRIDGSSQIVGKKHNGLCDAISPYQRDVQRCSRRSLFARIIRDSQENGFFDGMLSEKGIGGNKSRGRRLNGWLISIHPRCDTLAV